MHQRHQGQQEIRGSEVEGPAVPPNHQRHSRKAPPTPWSSGANRRDLRFFSSTSHFPLKAPPSPLSSRAKPRDLQFLSSTSHFPLKRDLPLCHPERSRGICGFFHPLATFH